MKGKTLRVWLLERPMHDGPGSADYEEDYAMVVVAASELEARLQAGDG